MAALAKSGIPSLCSPVPAREHTIAGKLAGAAIAAGDACYLNADGKVYPSTGAAANAAAVVDGYAAVAAPINEAVTLYQEVHFHYAAGMTSGVNYFLSGTVAGGLDTVASVGGTVAVARSIDATRLSLKRSW